MSIGFKKFSGEAPANIVNASNLVTAMIQFIEQEISAGKISGEDAMNVTFNVFIQYHAAKSDLSQSLAVVAAMAANKEVMKSINEMVARKMGGYLEQQPKH